MRDSVNRVHYRALVEAFAKVSWASCGTEGGGRLVLTNLAAVVW